MTFARKPAEPWDVEKAAELAGEALAYLARHYPECSGSETLRPYEEAAHDAALDADEERYKEALRGFMKAGRDAALEIRRGGGVSMESLFTPILTHLRNDGKASELSSQS